MNLIKSFVKRIKIWWFEWKLRRTYRPDSYVYEDDEIFEPEKESQESKNSS